MVFLLYFVWQLKAKPTIRIPMKIFTCKTAALRNGLVLSLACAVFAEEKKVNLKTKP